MQSIVHSFNSSPAHVGDSSIMKKFEASARFGDQQVNGVEHSPAVEFVFAQWKSLSKRKHRIMTEEGIAILVDPTRQATLNFENQTAAPIPKTESTHLGQPIDVPSAPQHLARIMDESLLSLFEQSSATAETSDASIIKATRSADISASIAASANDQQQTDLANFDAMVAKLNEQEQPISKSQLIDAFSVSLKLRKHSANDQQQTDLANFDAMVAKLNEQEQPISKSLLIEAFSISLKLRKHVAVIENIITPPFSIPIFIEAQSNHPVAIDDEIRNITAPIQQKVDSSLVSQLEDHQSTASISQQHLVQAVTNLDDESPSSSLMCVKSENADDLKEKLDKSQVTVDDVKLLKIIANQSKLLQLQEEKISQLESSCFALNDMLISLEDKRALVELENVHLKEKIKDDDSFKLLALIDDLIDQNHSQLGQIDQLLMEKEEKVNRCCSFPKKNEGSISAREQLLVLDKVKKEAATKCNSLSEEIAVLKSQLIEKDQLISAEKIETIKWVQKYTVLIKHVDKLVKEHNSVTESMNKQIQMQTEQIKVLGQVNTKMTISDQNDLLDISQMKAAIIFATKEPMEALKAAADEAQRQSATVSSLREQVSSLQVQLAEKDGIISIEQDELMTSKAKVDELAKEVDQILRQKRVEDEANAATVNQRHLKKTVHKLAELFGDALPTSSFHLKANRKKYWTSAKMKPAKLLDALEKELKKGRLDQFIVEKLGKSSGVSVTWEDAILLFVDAARRELIHTSTEDPSNNEESNDFEQFIKARHILESATTNWLKPIPDDAHKCIFQILKQ